MPVWLAPNLPEDCANTKRCTAVALPVWVRCVHQLVLQEPLFILLHKLHDGARLNGIGQLSGLEHKLHLRN
jgi:hypothetical protein